MRTLTVIALLLFTTPSFTQQLNTIDLDTTRVQYVEIYHGAASEDRSAVHIDYGQYWDGGWKEKDRSYPVDTHGRTLHFPSGISVVNYMAEYGWVCKLNRIHDSYGTQIMVYLLERLLPLDE